MEKHLAQIHNTMIEGNEKIKVEWEFDTSYLASRFLYRLRQAIHSANKLGIPPYDEISGRFSLRQHGKKVEAERKFGVEFENIQPTLIDKKDEVELKGVDSFDLIHSLSNLFLDPSVTKIKLIDLKEVSIILKGWLNAMNYDYEITRSGVIIQLRKKENASTT